MSANFLSFQEESGLMQALRYCGCDSLAWSLRRLHCPVDSEALVLEVGSGGSPYPRANVLLDAYEETRERFWVPLVADRPTALGFVEELPFRDKTFDFVIASHVLEHSRFPERFLSELQRVARAGYIEVPDAFMERLNPYKDHRLEVTARDGRLVIRKKPAWQADPELVELYEARVKRVLTHETMRRNPFQFHTRFYWKDTIPFQVVNPETDATWPAVDSEQSPEAPRPGLRARIQAAVLKWARDWLSQSKRNRRLELLSLCRCPDCHHEVLESLGDAVVCKGCATRFPIKNGVFCLLSHNMQRQVSS